MVEIRQSVWQVPYQPPVAASRLPFEVLTFDQLRRMDRTRRRMRPQRPAFHVVALVECGIGRHRADFVDAPLSSGSVAWIRPGTVHTWSDVEALDGHLVLFTPTAAEDKATALAAFRSTVTWEPGTAAFGLAWGITARLAEEQRAAVENPTLACAAASRYMLSSLLCRVAPPRIEADGAAHTLTRRFSTLIAEHVEERRDVAWYAAQLGCNPRTLTRASLASAGLGAKKMLDERTILEAKRLLAHTDLTAARVASRLGFDDPANFNAFFHRQAGTSPLQWRRAERTC